MCIIENENHFQFAKEVSVVTYKTKQREDILKAIQEQKGEFLVKDLYIALVGIVGIVIQEQGTHMKWKQRKT